MKKPVPVRSVPPRLANQYSNSPVRAGPAATNPRPKPKPQSNAPTSFGAAFRAARSKGAGTKFTWKGKVFSAVTAEDVSSGKFKKTSKGYVKSK